MGSKPKAGGPKKPPDTEKAKEKPQTERFIEAARSIGADETGGRFSSAIASILRPKQPSARSQLVKARTRANRDREEPS